MEMAAESRKVDLGLWSVAGCGRCPGCGDRVVFVWKTVTRDSVIFRIRECRACGRRWETEERLKSGEK